MEDFVTRAREELQRRGISLRAAARETRYDPAYLSRVLNRKQPPGVALANALDTFLGMDGELAALATPAPPVEPAPPAGSLSEEMDRIRSAIRCLLDHDNHHGGDTIAPAARQMWRAASLRLDKGEIPESHQRAYMMLVAELAEIAGWLMFDAGFRESSRNAFMEAHLLALQTGDRSMEWFALDMIAMQSVHYGSPGEAMRVADEIMSRPRVPARVGLLSHVRAGRALAQMGDRRRSAAALQRARDALDDSIGDRDPAWTWWVNECEIVGHEGEALLSLGDPTAAVPKFIRARQLADTSHPGGRGVFYYNCALLDAYSRAQAWQDCGTILKEINDQLSIIASGRNRQRLRTTLRDLARSDAPRWLTGLADEVSTACP